MPTWQVLAKLTIKPNGRRLVGVMPTHPTPLCPGGCTEGAMCPGCFRAWQAEGDALRLRQWLLSERLSRPRPANDVRRELRHPERHFPVRGIALHALIQL